VSSVGKSARAQNARLAELRAQQAAAERRNRLMIAAGTVAVVALIIGGIVFAALQGGGAKNVAGKDGTPLDQAAFSKLTTVPAAALDTVGKGTAQNPVKKIDAPALTKDGKPRVLYIGAEYCPFCASQRWPLVVALSRFGTWNNLNATYSAPAPEVFPDTPTVSFHGATYTSPYVSFTGIETQTNKMVNGRFTELDKLEGEDKALFEKYNAPPYAEQKGAIPWLTIGGTAVQGGASYSSEPLMGRTHGDIAAALHDPSTPIARGVLGTANMLTAQLCVATGGKPGEVCSSAGVKAAAEAFQIELPPPAPSTPTPSAPGTPPATTPVATTTGAKP